MTSPVVEQPDERLSAAQLLRAGRLVRGDDVEVTWGRWAGRVGVFEREVWKPAGGAGHRLYLGLWLYPTERARGREVVVLHASRASRVPCYFCGGLAIGLALDVGGQHHGDAMPACNDEEGAGFVVLSVGEIRQMFGPFPARPRDGAPISQYCTCGTSWSCRARQHLSPPFGDARP